MKVAEREKGDDHREEEERERSEENDTVLGKAVGVKRKRSRLSSLDFLR